MPYKLKNIKMIDDPEKFKQFNKMKQDTLMAYIVEQICIKNQLHSKKLFKNQIECTQLFYMVTL